ncbi:hypothetical protein MMC11_004014 [Xylographa trunciseda]|nr:hypothetical protein [Xylographa trunciseda]
MESSSYEGDVEKAGAGRISSLNLHDEAIGVPRPKEINPNTKSPESREDTANKIEPQYPSGLKLTLILLSIYLALFLVALDRTIIATAIPKITDDFHSLGDVGWYGSAFLLTGCAFMLIYGKIYTFYSTKWVFLSCIIIFEVGSAVCGAAPNSTTFIIGRAIAGLGSAGIMSGGIMIMVHTIPLAKRPIFQGLFGAVFGTASVIGPLLGGAFTGKLIHNVTWRWCFYINLPIGAVTIVALTFILKISTPPTAAQLTIRQQLAQLDPLGTFFFLPGIICLLLALQWGGSQYAWSSSRVIALLIVAALLLLAFCAVQVHAKDSATIPIRILCNRTVAAGLFYQTCVGASMMTMVFYIPIWFQSVLGVSAVESGIRVIALVLSLVVGSILAGAVTHRTGYYTPPMLLSSVIVSIGAGLITTWQVDTNSARWIGYQVLYGFGLGMGMQQANLGVQTVLSTKDVPIGASLMFFGQTFGGAVFISVAQNVFSNKLEEGLLQMQGLDAAAVLNAGATGFRAIVSPALLGEVLQVYNEALVKAMDVGLAMSCVGLCGAVCMEWRSIKNGDGQGEKGQRMEKGVKG